MSTKFYNIRIIVRSREIEGRTVYIAKLPRQDEQAGALTPKRAVLNLLREVVRKDKDLPNGP